MSQPPKGAITPKPEQFFELNESQQAFVQLNNLVHSENWNETVLQCLRLAGNPTVAKQLRGASDVISGIIDDVIEKGNDHEPYPE